MEFKRFALCAADNLLPGMGIVFSGCVVDDGVLFGLLETFAFAGDHMQKHRSVDVFESREYLGEMDEVVSVDRAEIAYAQRLEDVGNVSATPRRY